MTTPHPPTFLHRFGSTLATHAVVLAMIISLLIDGWFAWQIINLSVDQPLPPDRVMSKQLRVNDKQRLEFNKQLDAYHQPSSALPIPPGLF